MDTLFIKYQGQILGEYLDGKKKSREGRIDVQFANGQIWINLNQASVSFDWDTKEEPITVEILNLIKDLAREGLDTPVVEGYRASAQYV